ncbi:hypothetical protein BC826DRAFT_1102838 [Russula brevipes]|nr:hypothetical protein BC826DRAFT_1102838 [Russula brevipes]
MGSANSSIPAEPTIVAAAAVVGALGYGYVHYVRPTAAHPDDADTYSDASRTTSALLHGQKKRGRKLQIPGDAALKNLDILDAPLSVSREASSAAASASGGARRRQRPQLQPQHAKEKEAPSAAAVAPHDVVPGGFDGPGTSVDDDDTRDTPKHQSQPQSQPSPQHVSSTTAKKPKKKKGKKAAVPLDPSGAGASSSLMTASTEAAPARSVATPASGGKGNKVSAAAAGDVHEERWTRVEARKRKVLGPLQESAAAATATDVTTSDAGITTSATGNSSPVTERTTEDELPSELDESRLDASATSVQDAPPSIVPVRPPPGEEPAKGFTWEDYEGVQVDEDASGEEDGSWGVVRSRRKVNKPATEGGAGTPAAAAESQPQTKKQRQNAQRREALKEAKREREAQQHAALAAHKRELDHARATEQATTVKRTGSRFDSLGE